MRKAVLNPDDFWQVGQKIQIIAGPFIGFEGMIYLIDRKAHTARVNVVIFTRSTPVEVPLLSLKPIAGD